MICSMNDGELRACLDRELPDEEANSISQHLLECAQCRARLERLRSTATSVTVAMDSLLPVSEGPLEGTEAALVRIRSRARRDFGPRLLWASFAGMGLVLLLVALAITERHSVTPVTQAPTGKSTSEKTAGSSPSKMDGFLPLDDGEPIQMGFLVRMTLPASVLSPWEGGTRSGEIQADVIVDETGRARAVRFLK